MTNIVASLIAASALVVASCSSQPPPDPLNPPQVGERQDPLTPESILPAAPATSPDPDGDDLMIEETSSRWDAGIASHNA